MQVTDLTNPDGFVVSEPRLESNSAEDFLEFVMLLLLRGVLRAGDYLICDNAPIHFSEDIESALEAVLEASQVCCFTVFQCSSSLRLQVHLIFLPCYSPELNPAEHLFGMAKDWLRRNGGQRRFDEEIRLCFQHAISYDSVMNSYLKVFKRACGYDAA